MADQSKPASTDLTVSTVSGTDITITVGKPGNLKKFRLEGSTCWTARDVLKYADVDHTGCEIRINGLKVDLDSEVRNSDVVMPVTKVVGN